MVHLADNDVFRAFATYATIVLLKMMLLSLVTAFYRVTRKKGNVTSTDLHCSIKGIEESRISINRKTVRKHLANLNEFKSPGPDELHPRVLKEIAEEIFEPLSIIFENSWRIGVLPEDWRRANVVPIFKKGKKVDPGNYRPVFANPEDAAAHSKGGDIKKFLRTDQDVERVRRCHLNDIENIIPFVGVGLLYVLSNPDLYFALLHFRVFAASRVLHTISYLTPLPQPSRALTFFVGYLVTVSMAVSTLRSLLYI